MVDTSLLTVSLSVLVKTFCFQTLDDVKWSQNKKWLATKLFLGLTWFLVCGDIPICSAIFTFKYPAHSL